MLEFVISNYIIFIVAAIVLLLGLFGYMMDKVKYKKYREEIANEQKAIDALENNPDIETIATPILLDTESSTSDEETEESVDSEEDTIQN